MDQQKQPVTPDTKTAAVTPPPQKSDLPHDSGNKQATPAGGNQPPPSKEAPAATSAAPKTL